MARPFSQKVLSDVTSATDSTPVSTSGHNSIGMLLHLKNVDNSNDTVDASLEVSPDDAATAWATPRDLAGNSASTTVSDSNENDAVCLFVHGIPAAEARISITSISDAAGSDLAVDGWLLFANNTGRGYSNRER